MENGQREKRTRYSGSEVKTLWKEEEEEEREAKRNKRKMER